MEVSGHLPDSASVAALYSPPKKTSRIAYTAAAHRSAKAQKVLPPEWDGCALTWARESEEKDPGLPSVTDCVCPCFLPGFYGHLRREWRDS